MAVELRRVTSQTRTECLNQRDAFECLAARCTQCLESLLANRLLLRGFWKEQAAALLSSSSVQPEVLASMWQCVLTNQPIFPVQLDTAVAPSTTDGMERECWPLPDAVEERLVSFVLYERALEILARSGSEALRSIASTLIRSCDLKGSVFSLTAVNRRLQAQLAEAAKEIQMLKAATALPF
eukprot:scaffold1931_cov215-Ochromonas_danica.AAC.16